MPLVLKSSNPEATNREENPLAMYLLLKNQYNGDIYYSDETSTVLCMIASVYSVTLSMYWNLSI